MSNNYKALIWCPYFPDGDLSDAESVEVLASEELLVDDISPQEKCLEQITSDALAALISDSCGVNSTSTSTTSSDASTAVAEMEEIITPVVVDATTEDNEDENFNTGSEPMSLKKLWRDTTVKAFGHDIARLFFEVCIYSLIIDLVFLACFGLSSLSCLFGKYII